VRSIYLVVLFAAAMSAAAPGRHAVSCRWDSAYVSGMVMSHTDGLPLAHGSSVAPSGHLPSCWTRLTGSFTAGSCTLLIASHRIIIIIIFISSVVKIIMSLLRRHISVCFMAKSAFWVFFGPNSVKRGRTHIVLG